MRSAVIGIGNMGTNHCSIIRELGFDLVAVSDIDSKKSTKIPDCEFYTDYIEMLESVHPDVVHVCTPHYLHAEMIIECLNRNINVLCEKPLCISLDDIPRIIEAENKSSAILGVCQQNRYNPEILFAKDWLADKKILSAHASLAWGRDADYYNSGEWRGKWKTEGGGVLINQALHTLDLMQWLTAFPKTVQGNIHNYTHTDLIEVEDTAALLFDGDVPFSVFATVSAKTDMSVVISIITDAGELTILSGCVKVNDEIIKLDCNDKIYGKACYGSGHSRLIKDFYSHIESSTKFMLCGSEASKVVKMILNSYRSEGKVQII